MTTELSTKLTAAAVALMLNIMMIGGVAYLFSAQVHQPRTAAVASVQGTESTAANGSAAI